METLSKIWIAMACQIPDLSLQQENDLNRTERQSRPVVIALPLAKNMENCGLQRVK